MNWIAAILCCVLSADVGQTRGDDPPTKLRLILTPNSQKILQRDNLLIRVVLENPVASAIRSIEPPPNFNCYYLEVQLHDGGEWRRLVDADENANGSWDRPGVPKSVEPGKRYAEYKWFHRDEGSFLFERAGKYELRAVAWLGRRELHSDTVQVMVGERSVTDLPRLAIAPSRFTSVHWKIYDKWQALVPLGGNIKTTIQNFALVQEYTQTGKIKDQVVSTKEMCNVFPRYMDPVSWEYHLTLLGKHFVSKQDVEAIGYLLRAAPPFEAREFRDLASDQAAIRKILANLRSSQSSEATPR